MINGLVNKKMVPGWTEYGTWEYLLMAHPDENVNEQIEAEKKYFFDTYNEEDEVKIKPHITVANFLIKEEMEGTLLRWIQKVCNNQRGFTTVLNNFSGFPPHTIYLRVQDAQPFKQLAKELKVIENFIESNGCPPVKFITTPYLTIARRLPEPVYSKAIKDYAGRLFHASFTVNELLLLKRRNQGEGWKQVNVFRLPPGPKNLFN